MTLTTRLTLIHAAGLVVLLACIAGGYRFAYRPAMEARDLSAGLRQRLDGQRAELVSLQRKDEPAADPEAEPTPPEPVSVMGPELRPMTPTAFLSTFERLARRVGLRVESSIELDPKTEKAAGVVSPGILVEVTGTGTFSQVVELCGTVHESLGGLEIRRLRITRGQGDQVRWTMVCKNHDGPAG